ncbi:MAG TPA: TonB-dependent receptor [Methylocella sp.]|nr:TonB-dependent receptor [Methylocella sp.]
MPRSEDDAGASGSHLTAITAITETSTLALVVALSLQPTSLSAQTVSSTPPQDAGSSVPSQNTTQSAAQSVSQGDIELPTVEVVAPAVPTFASGNGWAPPPVSSGIGEMTDMNEAASAFTVTGEQVNERIFSRPGEALEIVPGLIATQHSGDGKANQWFLRGFNLDHGTDLAIFLDGMPMNMPTHAHGQGYADVNMLIPELIGSINIEKGPYFADVGDFASAGSVHINLIDAVAGPTAKVTLGSFDYTRFLGIDSVKVGDGNLLFAGEVGTYNGPWTLPGDLLKLNSVVRYSFGTDSNGFSVTGMAYGNHWNSTDQVPERAIPYIGLYGYEDPYDGGITHRFSLSGQWAQTDGPNSWHVNAFAVRSNLDLWNNFTYFLVDPILGDQFHQHESRTFGGLYASYTRNENISGVPTENEIGIQTRFDGINLLLDNTYERGFLSPIRSDVVNEGSIGVYLQQTAHWSDWCKTVIGIRGDFYAASDNQIVPSYTQALNSGNPTAFVPGPKASVIFGPFNKTEFYVDIGQGFHSNDVRGVTVKVEPTVPDERLNPGTFLVPTQGAEIGVRTKAIEGLNSAVAVFGLDAASENIFDGDAGDTQPTLLPTRRIGVEWTNDYHPVSWFDLDVDFADTRARFIGYDYAQQATYISLWGYPQASIGNAPGNYVPGAATIVGSIKATIGEKTGLFAGLEYRYFGPRPLTEDGAFFSPATGLLNARVGYRFENGWVIQLDGLNVTNSKSDQITYAYGSLLKTDALYYQCNGLAGPIPPAAVCANGVMDRVFKPVEPLQLRLTLVGKF